MTRCILGIDPGLAGALAFYFDTHPERVAVEDMPVAGGEVDAATLTRRVAQFNPDEAILERVHAAKGWGNGQTFAFGMGVGIVRGVLAALSIPCHLVTPTVWKRHHGLLKGDKEDSRALALRLFAATPDHFARKKDHGRADAALIARYWADRSLTRPQTEAA